MSGWPWGLTGTKAITQLGRFPKNQRAGPAPLTSNCWHFPKKLSRIKFAPTPPILLPGVPMNRFFGLVLLCSLSSVSLALAADPVSLVGHNLDGWKFKGDVKKSKWKIGIAKLNKFHPDDLNAGHLEPKEPPELVNTTPKGIDAYTVFQHGDCHLSLEFMVPKGSNSGVYLMGEYELQIFDSFGKEKVGPGDAGGIYGYSAPKENASLAPGVWQTLEIDFVAPKFEGAKKISNARFVKVFLNDKLIQEDVEVKAPTVACLTGTEKAKGPLMLQGDHGAVAFRKIRLQPK